jgi:hypothetical protein
MLSSSSPFEKDCNSTQGFDFDQLGESNFDFAQSIDEFDLEQSCLLRLKAQREKVFIVSFRSNSSQNSIKITRENSSGKAKRKRKWLSKSNNWLICLRIRENGYSSRGNTSLYQRDTSLLKMSWTTLRDSSKVWLLPRAVRQNSLERKSSILRSKDCFLMLIGRPSFQTNKSKSKRKFDLPNRRNMNFAKKSRNSKIRLKPSRKLLPKKHKILTIIRKNSDCRSQQEKKIWLALKK